jgi:hypothetical protein
VVGKFHIYILPRLISPQLEAIKQTKTNLTVWLANYNEPDDAGVAYTRQRDLIIDAIKTYGTGNIGGVTVGNEFMLKYVPHLSCTLTMS